MDEQELELKAHTWFAAFNEKDIEKLLSLYDNDAEHYSPKLKLQHPNTKGWIKGKQALREWWQSAFKKLPELHYELMKLTSNDKRIFMEYIRKNKGEDDLNVGEVLEFENGKIISSRVYHS